MAQLTRRLIIPGVAPTPAAAPKGARIRALQRGEDADAAAGVRAIPNAMPEEMGNLALRSDERTENEAQFDRQLEVEIRQSRLIQLVEGCLVEAVRQGASDIHIVPEEGDRVVFRFRVDGRLRVWQEQENVKPEAVAAVVKDRSRNVDRFEREAAQDGFIQRVVDGHRIRFRVSIMPIVGSEFERKFESVVIRVLDDRRVVRDLEKLGVQGKAREDFEKAITSPQGMVVLTGPTGSGKSTTLLAALTYVMSPETNTITVEEPVEYLIPGARQVKLGHHLNFDGAIRAILRHDPDIVMVGEIRDLKTAEIAIKLANTGHLTFSTLHTNDAAGVVSRLYKMGVESFLIANAINIVVAQRLVRSLCPHCKRPHEDFHPRAAERLGFSEAEIASTVFHRAVGCDKCHRGYKGRVAIHEALFFNREVRRFILESAGNLDDRALADVGRANGMLDLRAAGRERIRQGLTTCEEIAATTVADD